MYVWCGGRWCAHVVWWEMVLVLGDGVHMWCGGRWCVRVVWWEMVCTCSVVGDGVGVGRWCAHVVWWEMVCTYGVVGDGVHLSKLILLPEPLSYNYKLLVDVRRLCIANRNLMINTIAKPENTLQ